MFELTKAPLIARALAGLEARGLILYNRAGRDLMVWLTPPGWAEAKRIVCAYRAARADAAEAEALAA